MNSKCLTVAMATTATCFLAVLAQAGEVYAYPPAKRSEAEQKQDSYECHQWAVEQSKFDPVQYASQSASATPAPQSVPQASVQSGNDHAVVGGAAKGAVISEVSGGDAGDGAAAGAALGLLRGRMTERQAAEARATAQTQAQQRAKQQQTAQAGDLEARRQGYERARSTCFRARGYTVSEG